MPFKKMFVCLAFVMAVSGAHATAALQFGVSNPGLGGFRYESCFDYREPVTSGMEFAIGEFSVSFLWEFNTGDGKNVHFFTALDTGYFALTVPVSVTFGTMFKLFEKSCFSFELATALKTGAGFGFWGGVSCFMQPYVDFVIMGKSRTGFFAGVGLTTVHSWEAAYFEGFGWESGWNWFVGPHISFGLRFL